MPGPWDHRPPTVGQKRQRPNSGRTLPTRSSPVFHESIRSRGRPVCSRQKKAELERTEKQTLAVGLGLHVSSVATFDQTGRYATSVYRLNLKNMPVRWQNQHAAGTIMPSRLLDATGTDWNSLRSIQAGRYRTAPISLRPRNHGPLIQGDTNTVSPDTGEILLDTSSGFCNDRYTPS